MNARSTAYCFNQGLVNIKRNKLFSIASVATVGICVFLISAIFAILINVNKVEKQLEQNVGISIFFNNGIDQAGIDAIGEAIKADDRVDADKLKFISAEEAWESFKDDYFGEDADAAAGFENDNPLANSASYTVYLKDIKNQTAFAEDIKKVEGVRSVKYSDSARDKLVSFRKYMTIFSVVLGGVLLAVSIFLISTTVMLGISVRKNEIKIMKLIGATNRFVRSPFIIEGVIIGLVGSVIPLIIMNIIYKAIIKAAMDSVAMAQNISLAPAGEVFSLVAPIGLGIGAGIGFIGSMWSIRKHLKV